ncbi:hypothetical protein ANTRET_LOCUS5734 [Anthophora retusa]
MLFSDSQNFGSVLKIYRCPDKKNGNTERRSTHRSLLFLSPGLFFLSFVIIITNTPVQHTEERAPNSVELSKR